ncbi:MAG: hypothetical protein CVU65_14860 [Deltaproteobacteria bacterium HGW-Deltaproteobacteria-22]|jgi:hypothetical protein|nr:MAG: hypothetical protein CVU65_14860 [Deltaproteobacteria bacterium HGW-Deltaproteobacteria-22]
MNKNLRLFLIPWMMLSLVACDDGSKKSGFNSNNVNNTNNTNNTNNINNINNVNNTQMAIIRGRVWSPGSDDPMVDDNNRMPVPGALVAIYTSGIDAPPDGNYCNECVELPEGLPHVFTDADGAFEILIYPNTTYNLLVQKGEFRRVTQINVGGPGEVMDLNSPAGMPSNVMTTLPNLHDPGNGAWMPRIAVIKGGYEDMSIMFEALGFAYDGARVIEVDPAGAFGIPPPPSEADELLADPVELAKYNIIVITCGGATNSLTEGTEAGNLREWVRGGGKLYVDDFSYDWAEQNWPEFLSYYQEAGSQGADGMGVCGDGNPSSMGICNNWTSYSPTGYPQDQLLTDWLALPEVNRGSGISLQAAWNIIHELGKGPIGVCEDDMMPDCIDGIYYAEPKVWMRGDAPSNHPNAPMTVSWNYYCGKILYTVYHTHSESGGSTDPKQYQLIIQEKIMMYLIMEIQTCTKPNIIG